MASSRSLLWPALGTLLRTLGAALLLATLPRLLRHGRVSTAQALSIRYQRDLSPSKRPQIAVGGLPVRESHELQATMEGNPASFEAALKEWCRSEYILDTDTVTSELHSV